MAAVLTPRTTLRKFSDYFNTCLLPDDHPLQRARSPSPDAVRRLLRRVGSHLSKRVEPRDFSDSPSQPLDLIMATTLKRRHRRFPI